MKIKHLIICLMVMFVFCLTGFSFAKPSLSLEKRIMEEKKKIGIDVGDKFKSKSKKEIEKFKCVKSKKDLKKMLKYNSPKKKDRVKFSGKSWEDNINLGSFENEVLSPKPVIEITSDLVVPSVWTNDNIYHIDGNDIDLYSYLYIEPGTEITRAEFSSFSTKPGSILIANGTPENPIRIISDEIEREYYEYGIFIEEGTAYYELSYIVIEGGSWWGIRLDGQNSDKAIHHVQIHHSSFGIGGFGNQNLFLLNNIVWDTWYTSVMFFMDSESGEGQPGSEIRLINNTVDVSWDGIVVCGNEDPNNLGFAVVVNNSISVCCFYPMGEYNPDAYAIQFLNGYLGGVILMNRFFYDSNLYQGPLGVGVLGNFVTWDYPYDEDPNDVTTRWFINPDSYNVGYGYLEESEEIFGQTQSIDRKPASSMGIGAYYSSDFISSGDDIAGDLVKNGVVDELDLYVLIEYWGLDANDIDPNLHPDLTWAEVVSKDLTGEGKINLQDFSILAGNWKKSGLLDAMLLPESDPYETGDFLSVSGDLELSLGREFPNALVRLSMDGQPIGDFSNGITIKNSGVIEVPTVNYLPGLHTFQVAIQDANVVSLSKPVTYNFQNPVYGVTSYRFKRDEEYHLAGFADASIRSELSIENFLSQTIVWQQESYGNFNFSLDSSLLIGDCSLNELNLQPYLPEEPASRTLDSGFVTMATEFPGDSIVQWIIEDIDNLHPYIHSAKSIMIVSDEGLLDARCNVLRAELKSWVQKGQKPILGFFLDQAKRKEIEIAFRRDPRHIYICAHGTREVGLNQSGDQMFRTIFDVYDGSFASYTAATFGDNVPADYDYMPGPLEELCWDIQGIKNWRASGVSLKSVVGDFCNSGPICMEEYLYKEEFEWYKQDPEYDLDLYWYTSDMALAFGIGYNPYEAKIYIGFKGEPLPGNSIADLTTYTNFLEGIVTDLGFGLTYGEAIAHNHYYHSGKIWPYVNFSWVGNTNTALISP